MDVVSVAMKTSKIPSYFSVYWLMYFKKNDYVITFDIYIINFDDNDSEFIDTSFIKIGSAAEMKHTHISC